MSWTVPDKGEGDNDIQSILFQEYLDVLVAGMSGLDCVLSGGVVTPNTLLTLNGAKAATLSNGVLQATAASTTITITAADATNPRIDLVVINSSGAWAVRAGTAAAAPKPPARSANDVVMAAVYVPALDATIGAGQITDMRVVRSYMSLVKQSTAVTFNTTSSIQTLFSIIIPDGLFLAGRTLRCRMGGNFLSNSGNPIFTPSISFGGTAMFADPSLGQGASAVRGAWFMDFDIKAASSTSQQIVGTVNWHSTTRTTPSSGVAGDLGVASHPSTPIYGNAAVDCDAADRTLLIQMTMSVNSASVEIVMESISLEIL